MDYQCDICGRPVDLPENYQYDILCRKCVKNERAERRKMSKYFLKKEMKQYDKD